MSKILIRFVVVFIKSLNTLNKKKAQKLFTIHIFIMDKIKIRFSGECMNPDSFNPIVVLTLDDSGKNVSFEQPEFFFIFSEKSLKGLELPQKIMDEFTQSAISEILSKDEIPNESGDIILDGYTYNIEITCGDVKKEYYANDVEILTYPFLRDLASWYKDL